MDQPVPPLRNRKNIKRSHYSPLEDDSDADSFRRSNSSQSLHSRKQEEQKQKPVLCDTCWLKHRRTRATKHCADCERHFCSPCAKQDQTKRPWWVPLCFVHCLRFMFHGVFVPHTIVDFKSPGEAHWANSHEVNNVHRIPRAQRRRSDETDRSELSDHAFERRRANSLNNDRRRGSSDSNKNGRKLKQSRSFEDKPKRRRSRDKGEKKTRETNEALVANYTHDDIERLRRYKDNWHAFEDMHLQQERLEKLSNGEKIPFSSKVVGKEINIELTDTDANIIVNDGSGGKTKRNSKKKSQRNLCTESIGNCTEEIFEEVPIYFKRNSKERNRRNGKAKKDTLNEQVKNGENSPDCEYTSYRDFHEKPTYTSTPKPKADAGQSYTNYIVEEPPESCRICLEDLPGPEARTLDCYHTFHTRCIVHMLTASDSDTDFGIPCPVCAKVTHVKNFYASKDQWCKELPINTTV